MIRLTADDGHELDAYEAGPTDAAAGIVIVQEIFGVNAHIRDVVDRYGALGFRAVAPALFDRLERGVELGYTPETVTRGREMRWSLLPPIPCIHLRARRQKLPDRGGLARRCRRSSSRPNLVRCGLGGGEVVGEGWDFF